MPTSEFPPPDPITPDNTTAFPPAYTGPIVVTVDVEAYFTDDDEIDLGTDAAALGVTEGMLVNGFGIEPGTEVKAISGNIVDTSLTFNQNGDGSDLTFSLAIETTEFPPVVEPSALPSGTPPTVGNVAVWGPNGSLADGGSSTGLKLHLGDLYPDADMAVEMQVYSDSYDADCELALANGTVNGEEIVGWYVVDGNYPPGTTVTGVEEGTVTLSNPAIGDMIATVRLAETLRGTITVSGYLPQYDPVIHDLSITVELNATAWKYVSDGLRILLPDPAMAALTRRVEIQATAARDDGLYYVRNLTVLTESLNVIFETTLIPAAEEDINNELYPLNTTQTVKCLLRPILNGPYHTYELLQSQPLLPYISMQGGIAHNLTLFGSAFSDCSITGSAFSDCSINDSSFTGTFSASGATFVSPNFLTPALGTPVSGNLNNCTADATNLIGYRGKPQSSLSQNYTLALADAGRHIYHPANDIFARTWTIPANSSVAFPIGTVITIDNDYGAGALTIAITTDTLVLAGAAGSTGSRTLASGGRAELLKVTSTRWRIANIVGLT